jgi:D-glycero-alpha-D-manno-heptose-7-phosphate kinase
MIISRTPFRVSFFGGGTDYPGWFKNNKGAVLGTTINKYCYITCRYLPPFFDHKSRIIYSQMEHVKKTEDIDHPAVREVLKFLKINKGVEIHHDGDLPARTGLGSSSAFTVGLLNSLYALKGTIPTKEKLAKEAIFIEQKKCFENVGCQDQMLAAYGGFNFIEFGGQDHLQVRKMTYPKAKMKDFQKHIMMFFTGFHRPSKGGSTRIMDKTGDKKELKRVTSSSILEEQLRNMPKKQKELTRMYDMAVHAVGLLNKGNLKDFGALLDESWEIKKGLSKQVSNKNINQIYGAAKDAGALGGKILGAGGGGFIIFFAEPRKQKKIREKLKKLLEIPFGFDHQGSQVIFYQPNGE